MYEISSALAQYYAEIDPAKRLAILNDSDAPEFVHKLYHERYSDHEGKGRKNIDWWLWRCICLQLLYGRGGFFKSFRNREIKTILDELFMNDPDESQGLSLPRIQEHCATLFVDLPKFELCQPLHGFPSGQRRGESP